MLLQLGTLFNKHLQLQDSIKLIVAFKGKAEEVAFLVNVFQYNVKCLAVLPFSGMLVKPVAGWVADTFSLHRAVFLVCLAAMGVGYFRCQLRITFDFSEYCEY